MNLNFDKCKVLTPSVHNILIQGEHIENINNFVYLGSSVPNVKKDVKGRIALALPSFSRLRKLIWSNKDILLQLRRYWALIPSFATYPPETWALTTADEKT